MSASLTVAGLVLAAPGGAPIVRAAPVAQTVAPSSACARFAPPPTGDGRAAFRDLPIVSPGADRTLSLAIRAEGPSGGRFAGGVAMGGLEVGGVPVYAVTPAPGTQVQALDPSTGALADMPDACLADPAFVYGGMVWSLRQGDTLDASVTSAFDFQRGEAPTPAAGGVSCRGANLHTHGVAVSPYKRVLSDGRAQYGDYVFDFAAPDGDADGNPCAPAKPAAKAMDTAGGRMTPMRPAAGGTMRIVSRLAALDLHGPGGQPSGLFWYHPHPHGYAGVLTAGATTGAISVGDPGGSACEAAVSGGCAAGASLRVRYLTLRDAELAPDGNAWRLEHDRDYALEDACTSGSGDRVAARDGVCTDWRGRRWLFTVNGVRDPVITDAKPGRSEIWRIVNASPNVTYLLSLRPLDDGGPAKALPLGVISDEGASPTVTAAGPPALTRAVLLMPGARAEVAVTPPPAGGVYALEQLGFTTFGDVWPEVRLAEVRSATLRSPAPPVLRRTSAPEAVPADSYVETGAAAGCGFGREMVRRIYFVQRPSFADDRRKATLYGLLAGVQDRLGGPVTMTDDAGRPVLLTSESWRALLAGDPLAPAAMHNALSGVCTYLGHTEIWVIENDTDEDHDFHIHQSEFQLALDREGDPDAFSPVPGPGRDRRLAASDQAVAAADGRGRDPGAPFYQDTVAVPRGVSLGGRGCDGTPLNPQCRPGKITLRIRFDRDEQVGTFVYHCHILQHEDNGMMATVRVLCPPGDKGCAARHPGY